MKIEMFNSLKNGVYKVYWKEKHGGGISYASIGTNRDGSRWFAPANWVEPALKVDKKITRGIKYTVLMG